MSAAAEERAEKVRVCVSGALGRMGSTTCEAVAADTELALAAVVDPRFADGEQAGGYAPAGEDAKTYAELGAALAAGAIDVVVDFSRPECVRENIRQCIAQGVATVVGTTGLTESDLALIGREAVEAGVPVLVAPNFAMGAVLMMRFAEQAAEHLGACEIVELHHEAKLDSPSGTSRLTRERVRGRWQGRGVSKDVPIHSVRLPGLVAHQEVIFGGQGETLTIRHDSSSRDSFMPGVVLAIKRIRTIQGLVVGLENIL